MSMRDLGVDKYREDSMSSEKESHDPEAVIRTK